jgi:hypothetical protein
MNMIPALGWRMIVEDEGEIRTYDVAGFVSDLVEYPSETEDYEEGLRVRPLIREESVPELRFLTDDEHGILLGPSDDEAREDKARRRLLKWAEERETKAPA